MAIKLLLLAISLQVGVILAVITSPVVQASPSVGHQGDLAATREQWQLIKQGLKDNRESMCSFLLAEIDTDEDPLTVEKVTFLFEKSLEHLAKASEYVAKMRPFVEPKVVSEFDKSGSTFVLEISDSRRNLVYEYETAIKQGANKQQLRSLIERYFYKACSSKLGTILAEKSMYDSAAKVESLYREKFNNQ